MELEHNQVTSDNLAVFPEESRKGVAVIISPPSPPRALPPSPHRLRGGVARPYLALSLQVYYLSPLSQSPEHYPYLRAY